MASSVKSRRSPAAVTGPMESGQKSERPPPLSDDFRGEGVGHGYGALNDPPCSVEQGGFCCLCFKLG
jgi:hypothetical protein